MSIGRKSLTNLRSEMIFLQGKPVFYNILTGEIAIEVTGVVGVSPALWYFRYIVSIFLTLHKRLCISLMIRPHLFAQKAYLIDSVFCILNLTLYVKLKK
jgi:hypothetical protein